jgi:hypothetical protein
MDTSSSALHDDDDNARNNAGGDDDSAMTSGLQLPSRRRRRPADEAAFGMAEFLGVEAFLVGISPMYWAHVPMSILDIHNLQLVHGVQCMKLLSSQSNNNNNNNNNIKDAASCSDATAATTLVAVSKCSLVGMVVLVEQRPGSILFVLDDGTALVDCLLWMDKDSFELPSLTGESTATRGQDDCPHVGQMVRVLGRIECVSVQDVVVGETSIQQHCIREIHVTLVEPIPVTSHAQPHSLNAESWHWLEYSRHSDKNNGKCKMQMMNAHYILKHFLGPDIAAQVYRREALPSTHDKMAAWKLFGVACRCSSESLKYKDELLYCHCQATALVNNSVNDDNDAGFVYRDALLNRLLELQAQQQQQQQQGQQQQSDNDCSNGDGIEKQLQPLQFHYKTVASDSQLLAVLDSIDMSSSTMASSLPLQQHQQQQQHHRRSRIIQKTFAALRKDGILALLSVEADVYLLISRTFVLEPYIRMTTRQQQNSTSSIVARCPDYLSNVPKARLEFVRRTMSL